MIKAQKQGRKDDYKKRKSFYVYVDMRRLRLRGVSREAFIRAAKKYIDTHEAKKIKMMMQEMNMNDTPKFKNRSQAVVHLITQYLRHHEEKPNTAF